MYFQSLNLFKILQQVQTEEIQLFYDNGGQSVRYLYKEAVKSQHITADAFDNRRLVSKITDTLLIVALFVSMLSFTLLCTGHS
ncbi:hypothetical protein KP509_15G025500 [Ceratopteris richardii]|uniref:Uncharacterized protein n=1 Tax=Ceratopteris richardii TaxID=49495 RepID=A0A8T2T677_CERRI|nr:hypothetical protein KP509_15G025500 [Ceratopteris richardii]